MRISTSMVFQRGLEALQKQQSAAFETQQHISTGKRVLRPSDDPVAASRAVETVQAQALNSRYAANQAAARETLALTESTLANIGNVLQDARVILVSAGNGALSNEDRKSLATDLRAKLDQLIGLANSTDGTGNYLFSGYRADRPAYAPSVNGATYNGDEGRRELQVGPNRTIAVSEHGVELFERLREGNGVFVARSDPANNGTGVISVGRMIGNPGGAVASYTIEFEVVDGVTTYKVLDGVTDPATIPSQNYVSGAAITVDGMQFEITGEPAHGDKFTLGPAAQKNVFAMLNEAIAALETPVSDGASRARDIEAMALALANVDQAAERVLRVRTSMGSSLRELEALNEANQDNALHYEERLSELIELDYAAAISQLMRQQMALDAAQLSYQRVTSLSLFNYL